MPRFSVVSLFQRPTRAGVIAPERITGLSQWAEVLLIPLLAIAIGWLARPSDPLLLTTRFPWLWLAPVLISLRYGVMPGLIASLFIVMNWLVAERLGLLGEDLSPEYFFGGGLLVLLCGEFSGVWRDRNQRMDETNLYVTERLSRLTKRHLLLNLSHDRLEQEMLARPGSLRDALARLRTIAIEGGLSAAPMPGADSLLNLLSQYVNIESAALYQVTPKGTGFVLGPEVARLGVPAALDPDDELLQSALEQGSLVHIASKEVSLRRKSNQLIVAPLIAGIDTVVGILAVTRIPFFSLNVENLQMMSVILAYYADNSHNAPGVAHVLERIPVMPALYAEELIRMTYMQEKVGIASHIVVMSFDGQGHPEIPAEFLRIKRGLDLYWQTIVNGVPVIAVLLPFASPSAKDGFLARVEEWLDLRFSDGFDGLGIHLRAIDFATEDPLDALSRVLKL
jgi:polysaccharide biosynthesis protein PelD